MNVDVVWLTYNPGSIARGYWDQGLIEDLFAGRLWPTNGAPVEYVHRDGLDEFRSAYDGRALPGAIVVVPARHNLANVDDLNRDLAALPWVLLMLTGDEEALFPWAKLDHPRSAVWAMGSRPDTNNVGVDRALGSGYPPWFPELVQSWPPPFRHVRWFFAGQVTHARREDCAGVLRGRTDGILHESPGFTLGLTHDDYAEGLQRAQLAPCPSGPVSPDSFRLYEALEAGAVPIADEVTPAGPIPGYWAHVFGCPVPFGVIHDRWSDLATVLDCADYPTARHRLNVATWWRLWKRSLAYDCADTVYRLSGKVPDPAGVERVTVVIPTSPCPVHPSTDAIAEVVESIRAQLPRAEIIIAADAPRPELAHRAGDYDAYLEALAWRCAHEWEGVALIARATWGHQANTVRDALAFVRTPLLLFAEHDTPLFGEPIPWERCTDLVTSGMVKVLRFHHEASILEVHRHLMVDAEPFDAYGVPIQRTYQWSQRPHLTSTEFYRSILGRYFGAESRTMIEDVMHGVVDYWRNLGGRANWQRFRVAVYTPAGDVKRSGHLDTRGDDPKFDMVFEYDAPETPEGAPEAMSRRVPE